MAETAYEIIEQDGGWVFKIGDTVSSSYPSRQSALIHADMAASGQDARTDDGETSGEPGVHKNPAAAG